MVRPYPSQICLRAVIMALPQTSVFRRLELCDLSWEHILYALYASAFTLMCSTLRGGSVKESAPFSLRKSVKAFAVTH